ncbi:hypothetical protein IFR04_006516 [Cadophora malorum]|uniref:Secreted protein n=1 Tax=Cadophora malorum TaxID=108018 RepID=A0A8H7W7S1_9HELO|nr:hypothetical protein IFR04_006516 [Cadophora malorum]
MLYQPSLIGFVVAAAAVLSRVEGMALESRATVKHWGSGCPQGISDFWVKVDQTKVVAHFPAFDVTKGAGVAQSSSEEFCGIGIEFGCPAGRQFSVVSTTYRDAVDIPAGTTASHLMRYGFQGDADTADTRRDFAGPTKGTFEVTDTVERGDRLWSDCGSDAYLMITNRGAVTGVGGGASKHTYFNEGEVTTVLEWRSC